jgi:hypothetical protein
MNSIKKTARMAGLLYLIFIVTCIFAKIVRSKLIAYGDAATSANNIIASEWLFRIGFMSDLISAVFFILSAWALYVLLKPVNKNFALLFLLLIVGGAAIQCINMLNLFASVLLLNGADYLKVFQADQLHALAMLFLNLHQNGFIIAQVFYGTWLFPLGYLVIKSDLLPRILGVLLIIDCFGELIWVFQFFLFPGFEAITYPGFAVGFIAEMSLSIWLLIRGVKDRSAEAVKK